MVEVIAFAVDGLFLFGWWARLLYSFYGYPGMEQWEEHGHAATRAHDPQGS